MAGHVFITKGDLTKLVCDAWLLPTDAAFSVGVNWRIDLDDESRAYLHDVYDGRQPAPHGWGTPAKRAHLLPPHAGGRVASRAVLVDVGAGPRTPVSWYIDGVNQFFECAAAEFPQSSIPERTKPLFALPLVGTGSGGAGQVKGEVAVALVTALHDAATKRDVDVVLVTNSQPDFLAAQSARRRFELEAGNADGLYADLSPFLVGHAQRLASYAVDGRLVLFLGAGVSQSAGLPSWSGLLELLAADAGMTVEERRALKRLNALDQPRLIQSRLQASKGSIGEEVSRHLRQDRYALAHSLLASLPITEAVTTNYDTLFEAASRDAGIEAAVLPYQSVAGRARWLLKLHGSVTHPEDIVLTREDYLRYADRRAALAGIVQALLITRHMLFVGFSLTDDNFHRIVDDVRKALRGVDSSLLEPSPFGTSILLQQDGLLEELWRDDLMLVGMDDGALDRRQSPPRTFEIFLDCLASEANQGASPLLDPAFAGVLSEEEVKLRDLLWQLDANAPDQLKESAAWRPVEMLFRQLGLPERRSTRR